MPAEKARPRPNPTTFRATETDRAMIALLQQRLGETYGVSDVLREGLKCLLREHRLKLPETKTPKKRA